MAFVWDEEKAASNLRKHGIDFKFATRVFRAAIQAEWIDDREDYGEERWNVVGFVDGLDLLVTHAVRGEDIRISARRATKYEQKSTGEVRFELDPDNLPGMSEDRMAALKAMTDEDIDYSDTPEQSGPPTRRVFGPRFGNPQDVLALEPDVIQFFNETGGASSTRINAALREYAEAHRKSA